MMRETPRRWLGRCTIPLIGALLLSACEHYGSQVTLRGDERARSEDWPDPTRDPGEARPVQPEPRVVR